MSPVLADKIERAIPAGIIVLVVLVLVAAGLVVGMKFRDTIFDKIEGAKLEQVQASEQASAQHEASAKVLLDEVVVLRGQLTALKSQVTATSNQITQTERSRKNAEQELQTSIRAVDNSIDIHDRCQRVCDRARSLGLVAEGADCNCK